MSKRVLLLALTFAVLALFAASANAKITASIQVKDVNGNVLNDGKVPINTIVHVYGHYEDLDGNSPATGVIDVYFSTDGSTWTKTNTLFVGTVQDGDTVTGDPYTLTQLGQYQFRWICQLDTPTTTSCVEIARATTTISLPVPEPATIIGLIMAFSAFGFLAFKRNRIKK